MMKNLIPFLVMILLTLNLSGQDSESWFWSGVLTGRLGYRYQAPDGRIMMRLGFTPFFEYEDHHYEFHPSGGLAIGYCF